MNRKLTKETEIMEFFTRQAVDRNAKLESTRHGWYEQKMRQIAVFELLRPERGERILDVGCGNLRDSVPLAKMGCEMWGVDFSLGMLKEGRESAQKEGLDRSLCLARASALYLPFRNECFDKIICSEVIEHIPQWELAIAEMTRCLKRGGMLVVDTPNRQSLYGLNRKVISPIQRLLGRKRSHPYDEWKTQKEVVNTITKHGLRIDYKLGICFLPGYSIFSMIPLKIEKLMVKMVEPIENKIRVRMNKWGYLLGISAVKQ